MEHWTLVIATVIFIILIVLYQKSDAVRYNIKINTYHFYLLFISHVILLPMAIKGRCNENIYWCKKVLILGGWIFGLSAKVKNQDNLIINDPCVIVSNHQSSLDLLGMGIIFPPKCSFLAKKMLLYLGSFGFVLWLAGGIFINRSDKKKSADILLKAGKEIKEKELQVWIFPEGTRHLGDEMLPFKKGAFNLAINAQIPIQPIVFSSYKKFYNPKKHLFQSGSYTIEILPAVSTEGLTLEDSTQLSEDIRKKMMDVFNSLE